MPGLLFPLVLLLPQAEMLSRTKTAASDPISARQLRRRAGIPKKTSKARTVAPAPSQPLPRGRVRAATGAVVMKVSVTLPLLVVELSVTGDPVTLQLGTLTAFAGVLLTAHVTATLPEYPLDVVTVTVEEERFPGVTAPGVVAARVYASAETVMLTLFEAVA